MAEQPTVFGPKATEQIAKTVREVARRMMLPRGERGRWQFHGGGGGGGGASIWGTVEEVVCAEEGTYCWVTVTDFSGKCGESVPGEITVPYDEHLGMIKVEQVCEIFMAYYTEAQLTGKIIEAGLFWRRDEETNECLPTWLVRQVCGAPECA